MEDLSQEHLQFQHSDVTKDSINDINFILGKLVPDPPTTINNAVVDLTNDTEHFLCAGFTPTNNTGGAAPDQTGTTSYVRNNSGQVTTDTLTEYGPGDAGTVKDLLMHWCRNSCFINIK